MKELSEKMNEKKAKITKDDVVYISGPMSGIIKFNIPAFYEAESLIRGKFGCKVLNPAKHEQGLSYDAYLKIDLVMVEVCTVMVLLPGWEKSEGAQKERYKAVNEGKKILKIDDIFYRCPNCKCLNDDNMSVITDGKIISEWCIPCWESWGK